MGKTNFRDDFKRDAVHQIAVRGYEVREVSERLGVSTHSLYQWVKKYTAQEKRTTDYEADENRRLSANWHGQLHYNAPVYCNIFNII